MYIYIYIKDLHAHNVSSAISEVSSQGGELVVHWSNQILDQGQVASKQGLGEGRSEKQKEMMEGVASTV